MTDSVDDKRNPADSAVKEVPPYKWKWVREWVGFGLGFFTPLLSVYLSIKNQNLKHRNEELEANEIAIETQNLPLGNEEVIYRPFGLVMLDDTEQEINHGLILDPVYEPVSSRDIFKVVINHEEQYSIWPSGRENALGWFDVDKVGTRQECLQYIEETWVDRRPLSLRKITEESETTSDDDLHNNTTSH